MSSHARKVATALRTLADDIATGDRLIYPLKRYRVAADVDTPVVPRAIHDALCPSLAVLSEDEDLELLVCDRCKLAVENGAQ